MVWLNPERAKYYREKYREKRLLAAANWRSRNKERVAAYQHAYRRRNRAKMAEQFEQWKARNPERWKELRRAHYERHRYRYYSISSAYRSRRKEVTPKWANEFFIAEIYHLARLRTIYLGIKHHVDHIVPLRSKLVCGLHCEANLRVISAVENNKKNNKTWPDMPTHGQ